MKKFEKLSSRICALVLVFCMASGVFATPQTVKAAESDYYNTSDYTSLLYVNNNLNGGTASWALLGDASGIYTLDTNYTHFRIVIFLSKDYEVGTTVNFSGYVGFSGGTLTAPYVRFATSDSSYSACSNSTVCSVVNNSSFFGSGSKVSTQSHVLLFEVSILNRTASNIHIDVNHCTLSYTSPVETYLKEDVQVSNNILDNIKSMLSSLINLPSNIKTNLSTLFSNIVTATNNVKTAVNSVVSGQTSLGDLFEDSIDTLGSAINQKSAELFNLLPSGIRTSLESLFANITNAVDAVKTNLTSIGSDIVSSVVNLPSNLSGFFNSLGNKLDDLIGLFNRGGGGGHSIDSNPLEQATNDLNNLRDNLSNDYASSAVDDLDDYIPNENHLLLRIYSLVFENHLMISCVYLSLIFGVIGYVLFGKR